VTRSADYKGAVLFDASPDHEGASQEDWTVADDRSSEPPSRKRKMARWLVVLAVLATLALVAAGVGGLWVKGQIDPSGPPGEEIAFEVPKGATTSEIADLLADAGIITSGEVFRWYLRLKGGGPFDAGQYRLSTNSSMGDVVRVLEEGPALPPAVSLTIPESLWIEEVAARVDTIEHLDGARFLELANSGTVRSAFQPEGVTTLEGLLYPETYRIEDSEDEEAVLRRMVETFDQVATELGYADAEARVGVSPYEAIIVASLVEAEAKVDEDRPKIARVIYNRLEQGIPLGIDATFYYHLGLERKGTGLRRSDLEQDHEYNTRLRQGLIPRPISMSRRASLEAALNPEPGPWLYYVLADADGHHAFSESYDEFLRNKRAAQENGLIP
jgi:UPF0755 protein